MQTASDGPHAEFGDGQLRMLCALYGLPPLEQPDRPDRNADTGTPSGSDPEPDPASDAAFFNWVARQPLQPGSAAAAVAAACTAVASEMSERSAPSSALKRKRASDDASCAEGGDGEGGDGCSGSDQGGVSGPMLAPPPRPPQQQPQIGVASSADATRSNSGGSQGNSHAGSGGVGGSTQTPSPLRRTSQQTATSSGGSTAPGDVAASSAPIAAGSDDGHDARGEDGSLSASQSAGPLPRQSPRRLSVESDHADGAAVGWSGQQGEGQQQQEEDEGEEEGGEEGEEASVLLRDCMRALWLARRREEGMSAVEWSWAYGRRAAVAAAGSEATHEARVLHALLVHGAHTHLQRWRGDAEALRSLGRRLACQTGAIERAIARCRASERGCVGSSDSSAMPPREPAEWCELRGALRGSAATGTSDGPAGADSSSELAPKHRLWSELAADLAWHANALAIEL